MTSLPTAQPEWPVSRLDDIVGSLQSSAAISDKIEIRRAYAPALEASQGAAALGDDCAAIPDPSGGYLLFAAEGLLERFVADDPWFAGYSAVMVNISDICAMGGRPIAVVDVLWTPDHEMVQPVWEGMTAASKAYGVPIVGGHTTITRRPGGIHLAVSIVGRATTLLTSFDARPGDALMMVVDLDGSYRGDKPFWNATLTTSAERLREIIRLPSHIADNGWCKTVKDISNGGIIGTLIMMLESSRVGASLDLARLPIPPDVAVEKWLISFPSYGYLMSAPRENEESIIGLFTKHDLDCRVVGEITSTPALELTLNGESRIFWQAGQGTQQDA